MIDRLRLRRGEAGISFVEMMVATAIAAIVGSLLIAALTMVTRVDRFTRQDSEVLAELRTATERFQKELRQARKIYYDAANPPLSTTTVVHFWVDYDRNNQQEFDERIIWRLETLSSGMRLVRTTRAKEEASPPEAPFIEAVDLVSGSSFSYAPAPPDTTVVTLTLRGDASSGAQPSPRTVKTSVRLRNATS